MTELKKYIKVKTKIIRAIPLPPISLRKGPVPIFPPDKQVRNFFNKLIKKISNLFIWWKNWYWSFSKRNWRQRNCSNNLSFNFNIFF